MKLGIAQHRPRARAFHEFTRNFVDSAGGSQDWAFVWALVNPRVPAGNTPEPRGLSRVCLGLHERLSDLVI